MNNGDEDGKSLMGKDAENQSGKGFSPLVFVLSGLVHFYRYLISPLLGASCRYQPTCSQYALDALKEYGGLKGGWMALKRIGRCHPWGGSGFDPVPGRQEHQKPRKSSPEDFDKKAD